jgi:hypothetical protein
MTFVYSLIDRTLLIKRMKLYRNSTKFSIFQTKNPKSQSIMLVLIELKKKQLLMNFKIALYRLKRVQD